MNHWHVRFMEMAKMVAGWSKDPSTKVGCVIVNENRQILAMGYNGFPRHVQDSAERYENRDIKYLMVCHAEANAIAFAANTGVPLDLGIAFVTAFPCSQCAALLIQAGIKDVFYIPNAEFEQRWMHQTMASKEMFQEAQVAYYPVEL